MSPYDESGGPEDRRAHITNYSPLKIVADRPATPLQAALISFATAIQEASADRRTLVVFLDIASIRIAREYSARLREAA